ncbi:BolA family protein [Agaribacterium haliotis]|uniref:BolA family protein n=1 Tax=Agaribacterium haliotis TaxID=2013869 RepID=UPI000BB534EF|nr:BolA/IbaG family iron-sulfur metabolism protein [Agaribacterium haliotis]
MQVEEIKALVEASVPESIVEVQVDGSHIALNVVSPAFEGLNTLKKQQLVYAGLQEAISSGAIHAVQMKTYTPEQWQAHNA